MAGRGASRHSPAKILKGYLFLVERPAKGGEPRTRSAREIQVVLRPCAPSSLALFTALTRAGSSRRVSHLFVRHFRLRAQPRLRIENLLRRDPMPFFLIGWTAFLFP